MSLEYSMFRFSDDYPTADGLAEMIMQVCMDEDRGDCDNTERLIRSLVVAADALRHSESSDDEEVSIPTAHEPGRLFMDKYSAACRKLGFTPDAGDIWWEDWWPTNCPWHPDDIAHLARLKAGQSHAIRRQLRQMFADKEATNAND